MPQPAPMRCAGTASAARGRHDEARQLRDEGLQLATQAENALMIAESRLASSQLALRVGDRERAREEAGIAAAALEELGARRALVEALSVLASCR